MSNDYRTFDRINRKFFGSTYQQAKRIGGQGANPLRFPSWPNPVNYITNYEILACEDTIYAHIVFAFGVFAAFAWATFVPSPAELTRKLVLNNYKCGFYFAPGLKSPMKLFFPPGGVEMIAEISRPFTAALFYWWVAESAFGAFDAWQTVMHREEFCEEHACSLIVQNLTGLMLPGTRDGLAGAGTVIRDECGLDPGGAPQAFVGDKPWTAAATFDYFDPTGQITAASLQFYDSNGVIAEKPVPIPQPGRTHQQILVHHDVGAAGGIVGVQVHYTMADGPAGAVTFHISRWIVSTLVAP